MKMKMKKVILVVLMQLAIMFSYAQTYVNLNQQTNVELTKNTETNIRFSIDLDGFYLSEEKTKEGIFTKIIAPGYFPNKDIGFPELPVLTRLIEIPHKAEIEINVINYEEEIVFLNDYGYVHKVKPNQVSLFKNQNPDDVPFEINSLVYDDKQFYGTELVEINHKGIMRGINISQLIVSPFSYDIESNSVTIRNNIEVEVIFHNADIVKSENLKANKYSPIFESAYRSLWNYREPSTKSQILQYPIKYVIIADRVFEEALQDFIEWKTKKGFYVIESYTDDPEVGTTTEDIHNYLKSLYEAGTTEDPAPSYVLFVGDIDQIPSFSMGNHVSDMYYCEFDGDGDYVPDMYFGRFSANNVDQLLPQIEKTLMYEKFAFPEPEFIVEAVLVAGHDNNWAPTHGNGQINYATNYYFNENIGVVDHTYLHPASNGQAAEIIADMSNGVGFVNFTAHCNSNGWAGPNFTTSDIPSLQNENKYFFMISNCCQPNKFDIDECFGEAIVRADKKGAVVHIGGSNNTMWDEDFYWSVGITSNVTANPTYEGTTTAVFDHMFHFNDEVPYRSAYELIFIGNMQVMASTSTRDKYYWEIYHVMGDPSVMAYVGETVEIHAEYLSTLPIGMSSLLVTTEPDAYVAISHDGVLLDAKLADINGEATLEFEPLTNVGDLDIVVTKQFRAPHINSIMVVPNDNDYDAMLQTIIHPQSNIHISKASFSPTVRIINLGQINLESVTVGYYFNEDSPTTIAWEGNLETLESEVVEFSEISLEDGLYTFTAYVENPNGQTDQFPDNDIATRNVTVYSGNVNIQEVISPEAIICNENSFIPQILIRNRDDYTLTELHCSYISGSVTDALVWTGNLEPDQTTIIEFPENEFPVGSNTISFSINNPNGGTNINTNNITMEADYYLVSSGNFFELDFLTDRYGDENTWELVNEENQSVLYSGGPYPSGVEANYIYNWCLGPGCYTFTVYDSYGDGMGGFMWFGDPGHVLITNLDSDEIILDLEGDHEDFLDKYSVTFCVEQLLCPNDMVVTISDEEFQLSGAQPTGGVYSGNGVSDGYFNPEIAGVGEHTISYTYTFDEEMTCDFIITVQEPDFAENTEINNINIYPNPTTGTIFIDNIDNVSLEIVDMLGQIIKRKSNIKNSAEINISEYPNGTYFIRIINGNTIVNKKINLIK